jgi:hypothetical protein
VTIEAASLAIKSGNAAILRGGSEALHSNLALWRLVQAALVEAGVDNVRVSVSSCPANPADLDHNGVVDAMDLATVLNNWGNAGAGDVNGDGVVDALDLAAVLNAWG